VQIAIISDTHLPRGGRRLPDACVAALRRASLILHAGDLVELSVFRELERFGEVIAVQGNVDTAELRALLPARTTVRIDDCTIGVVHDAGPKAGRVERLRRWFPEANAVVFGHSHIPLHAQDPAGFQIFNPGSPTVRRRAPRHTMGVAEVRASQIQFELLALD
jgi:putative phosphoesterase